MEENMEKALNVLVKEFLDSTNLEGGGEKLDFEKSPVLRRLLQSTFENKSYRLNRKIFFGLFPRNSLTFLAIVGSILAIVWFPILQNLNTQGHTCLWRTPDWLRDLLRTPVNCSVCKNLTQIDRIENIFDPNMFIRTYVDVGKPVVVIDATKNWSARRIFSFDFFRSIYSNKSRANCQFFRYRSKFESLQDVFERASLDETDEPWYVGWSNCDGEIAEILRAHYDRPYFLPHLSESAHTDWIFMGSPAYGAHLHVDDVDYPSWQAQIHGRKKWLLYPPPECHYACPRRFLKVILEPGDTLVVDTNWWYHQTLVVGDQLSISIGSEFD